MQAHNKLQISLLNENEHKHQGKKVQTNVNGGYYSSLKLCSLFRISVILLFYARMDGVDGYVHLGILIAHNSTLNIQSVMLLIILKYVKTKL